MKSRLIASSLCILAIAAALAVVARSRSHGAATARQREMFGFTVTDKTPQPPFITQLDSPPGVLALHATAPIKAWDLTDRTIWWTLEIRREEMTPDRGFRTEVVWSHDYRHQSIPLPANQSINTDFTERLDMPAGKYQVWIEVRDSLPHVDRNGVVVQDYSSPYGKLQEVTVR